VCILYGLHLFYPKFKLPFLKSLSTESGERFIIMLTAMTITWAWTILSRLCEINHVKRP